MALDDSPRAAQHANMLSDAQPDKPPKGQRRKAAKFLTFAEWAKTQDLSAPALAVLLDLHRSTVVELLAGRRWPTARTALQVHEASGGLVRFWDTADLAQNIRVRVRAPEPRPRRAPS